MTAQLPPLAGLDADTRPEQLSAAETATFATNHRIPAIYKPLTQADVQVCLRAANADGFCVYPVSSGKNWGYGSSVPAANNCVLLDLSAMNRIVDFNERLGYVTVEPGVTQRQLHEFLAASNSGLWMDATGSSPECSLIGNAVERGFGHTPYGDHFANVCGLEVVLPDGEVVETGFAGLPGARASSVYRWGAGASLDGLFSQSNFGVVTRMTIWLMPKPECFEAYFFQSGEETSLVEFIEALRPLRMNGTLRSTVHIANDYKVLNGIQQFPAAEVAPLSRNAMTRLRAELKFGRWNGSGALYGSKAQVAEAKRLVRSALKGKASKLNFLNDRTLALAARFTKPFQWITGTDLSRTLELVRPVFGLMKGEPTSAALASAYWRKKFPAPADPDPDRDGCGLIWAAPVAPADGESVRELVGLAEETLLTGGFEPLISLTMITERSVACVIAIAYDREVEGEDERAMQTYRTLQERLCAAGFYPYRLGIQSMDLLDAGTGRRSLLTCLKRALDPKGVLAPNRYLARTAR